MATFAVTATDLLDGAQNCRTTNDMVQTQIQQMVSYVAQLMGSYQGNAAQAMDQVTAQWNSDASALNMVLTTIASGLTSNANNYTDNESTNTTNYANIGTSLPPAQF